MGNDDCKDCKKCLKKKVNSLETQLANQTKKVDTLETQLANVNQEYRRLIEKFNINKEKLKKSEAEKGKMKEDLEFYKQQNTLGIRLIQLYIDRVIELEGRNPYYYQQMPSTSMDGENRQLEYHM